MPEKPQQVVPDIAPMRRGRPTAAPPTTTPKSNTSPVRGAASDPFAALDSKQTPAMPQDEIADRFPSLDQFSLLHDNGKFEFGTSAPPSVKPKDLSQRVTERLADDAFKSPPLSKAQEPFPKPSQAVPINVSKAQKIISSSPALQTTLSTPSAPVYEPKPSRSTMISTGTMISPSSTPPTNPLPGKYTPTPIYRFPPATAANDHHRSASLPRSQPVVVTSPRGEDRPSTPGGIAPKSSAYLLPAQGRHTSSSRPSLEGGRPSQDSMDPVPRTRSSNSRPRPSSTYLESNMDYLREKESTTARPNFLSRKSSSNKPGDPSETEPDDENAISSNVDFLRSMEEQNDSQRKDRRRSSNDNKSKRSSLPSMSLTGTKTLLAGRFGDAFKRFEGNASNGGPRTPSPLQDMERRDLTPIAGSEATDGRSDDGHVFEDSDVLPPEQRRELERRRLSMEEKRVAAAAAEYRQRLAARDAELSGSGAPLTQLKTYGGATRASTIQNKVRNLLDESQKVSPPKTADGYGRYTGTTSAPPVSTSPYPKPSVARKPIVPTSGVPVLPRTNPELHYPKSRSQVEINSVTGNLPIRSATISARTVVPTKPSAPPKPIHLNSTSTGPQMNRPSSPPKPSSLGGQSRRMEAHPDMTLEEKEDYIQDFSKRFPSLSGIEMVESEIGGSASAIRTREV